MPISSHASALWRDNPATPAQQQHLPFGAGSKRRPTQSDVLLQLLRSARAKGEPLPLPAILDCRIAQHGARIAELRQRGFVIANRMTRVAGVTRSQYVMTYDPERDAQEGR